MACGSHTKEPSRLMSASPFSHALTNSHASFLEILVETVEKGVPHGIHPSPS
jgi:hypothetical protein